MQENPTLIEEKQELKKGKKQKKEKVDTAAAVKIELQGAVNARARYVKDYHLKVAEMKKNFEKDVQQLRAKTAEKIKPHDDKKKVGQKEAKNLCQATINSARIAYQYSVDAAATKRGIAEEAAEKTYREAIRPIQDIFNAIANKIHAAYKENLSDLQEGQKKALKEAAQAFEDELATKDKLVKSLEEDLKELKSQESKD